MHWGIVSTSRLFASISVCVCLSMCVSVSALSASPTGARVSAPLCHFQSLCLLVHPPSLLLLESLWCRVPLQLHWAPPTPGPTWHLPPTPPPRPSIHLSLLVCFSLSLPSAPSKATSIPLSHSLPLRISPSVLRQSGFVTALPAIGRQAPGQHGAPCPRPVPLQGKLQLSEPAGCPTPWAIQSFL